MKIHYDEYNTVIQAIVKHMKANVGKPEWHTWYKRWKEIDMLFTGELIDEDWDKITPEQLSILICMGDEIGESLLERVMRETDPRPSVETVKAHLARTGKTQEQLGKQIGKGKAQIGRWVRNKAIIYRGRLYIETTNCPIIED